jgi:hypothetical protein
MKLAFVLIIQVKLAEHFLQECHNFLAGDVVRSRAKNAKLDVRGVFGSICRHEFPALFIDMHHGERYYVQWFSIFILLFDSFLKIGIMCNILYFVKNNLL